MGAHEPMRIGLGGFNGGEISLLEKKSVIVIF
jgi:hypothetical protein